MFKEASRVNADFQNNFVEVSNLKNRKILVSLIQILLLTAKKSSLLFTLVTPLQNFNKLNPYKTNLKALFYTHDNRKLLPIYHTARHVNLGINNHVQLPISEVFENYESMHPNKLAPNVSRKAQLDIIGFSQKIEQRFTINTI